MIFIAHIQYYPIVLTLLLTLPLHFVSFVMAGSGGGRVVEIAGVMRVKQMAERRKQTTQW